MHDIRAIIFDSNVFGRQALPNITTIRLWAGACAAHDADLWIPEVVAYELAQHVVEAHDVFREQLDAHRQRLKTWGQPTGQPLPAVNVEDVLNAIRQAGAEIISLDEEDAREAILDQVLLRGVGSRKSGVKTGAADSAWVRSVIAYNDGESDGLIIVTGDSRALERTCAEIGVDVPMNAKHLGEVSHLLDDSVSASEELRSKYEAWVQEYFVGRLGASRAEGADLGELADLDAHHWWEVEGLPDDGYEEWELQDRVLAPVSLAEVMGEVEHDRWSSTFTARVRLTAEVEEQYARQDPFGDFVQYRARTYPGSVQAKLRLFSEGNSLEFDGVLDDVELLSPASIDVGWTSI